MNSSCWGQAVNGVQQMGTCDYFSLAMWVLGFFGVCLIAWGVVRNFISHGLQGASYVAGSQQGASTFGKEAKIGTKMFFIGAAMLAIAILIGHFLPA